MPMPMLKLIFAGVVFLTGLAGGMAALRLGRSTGSRRWFSLGSALAGGVFLGAGLIHLLPDAAQGFGSYFKGLDYPLAFAMCAMGFLALLLLEKVLFAGKHDEPGAEAAAAGPMAFLLTIVLSFHSLLAGLALGVESSLTGSLAIFLAIVAHKGSAGFALGVDLERARVVTNRRWMALIMFSLSTPIGIMAGTGLDFLASGPSGRLVEAVFDSLAAGTFLYIAVLDIIQEEFFKPTDRWPKFLLLVMGLVGMALLALWL
jgi:zinc transporter 1/2/3